jgi:hypothetical protein
VTTRADIVKHVERLKVKLLEYRIRETMRPIEATAHVPSEVQYRIQTATEALQLFDELDISIIREGGNTIREAKP